LEDAIIEIKRIVCPDDIQEKIETKRAMTFAETRQVLVGTPRFRFVERGHREDQDVYAALAKHTQVVMLSFFLFSSLKSQQPL